MKKLLLILPLLLYWSCNEPTEEDTTPPTVFISSPVSGQTVYEIITITVTTQDNEGISKVEFFIDNSLAFTDSESPYEYVWNTTTYENGSEHIVKVISYDNSDNSTTSQPIMLTVDNSTSTPNGGNIISVTYTLDEMTVEWEESTDGDFKDYKVLYSDTENGDKDTLETYTDKSTTSYTITEFDPLIENWFWIQVTDTMGLSSIGSGMTNSLDSEPTPVNVTSVTYDLESMTITWEEYVPNVGRIQRMNQNTRSTVTNDFVSYELLQSDGEDGTYTSVTVITDQSITSHSLTEYDPTQENWFKVRVTDYWGLNSTGNGMTNEIESTPPNPSEFYPITYQDNTFIITWSQNVDDDFHSYSLHESFSEDMSSATLINETDLVTDTTYTVTGISAGETRYYQVVTKDAFGLETESAIEIGMATRPLPTEFPLDENVGWVYTRYYYADNFHYIEDIPSTVFNDTLFILTDIDEDGYSGYSWDLNSYYSVVKNYDNKFINAGFHDYYDDTTYYNTLPYIWAAYDEFYDTTGYSNNYGGFPSSRTEVVDTFLGVPYETYNIRWDDEWSENDYVTLKGFAKFTIASESNNLYTRIIMIDKLNYSDLQNALNIAREQVSPLPNNASNNFINSSTFISPAFGLNR